MAGTFIRCGAFPYPIVNPYHTYSRHNDVAKFVILNPHREFCAPYFIIYSILIQIIHKNFAPNHVEIDFCWAMIYSICQSFNHENLEGYLNACWEMNQCSSSVIYSKTVIHICSAHIMHRFSHKLNYTLRASKETKRRILFVMARLINSVSFKEIDSLFFALCVSVLPKLYSEVQQNISILEMAINYDEEQVDMEIEYLAELDEELPNELGYRLTYNTKSPYGRHFQNILTTSQALINQLDIKHVGSSKLRNNFFFLPKLPIFVATHYMPICPLWTGFILAKFLPEQRTTCRCSNAIQYILANPNPR